jgi:glycosyltransferase involved in cell wall biosynthesis
MVQISVVIPSYKPGTYIYKCLDSLRMQTLPSGEFDVFVVLNASEDIHEEMLRRYITEQNITNISVLRTSIPGVSNARNMGLDAATGAYV